MYRSHVLVCGGTGCTSSGSEQIIQTLKDELKKLNLELDKLFGKNTFPMAHNYINDLLRMN